MSDQITTAFVKQYQDNVTFLSQQKGSRLRDRVEVKENVVGKTAFFDQIGKTSARRNPARHSDSPLISNPHERRAASLIDIDTGDLVDKNDTVRLLIDPTSKYSKNMAWAIGREIDDIIIEAALGTAKTGEEGTGSQALPSAQKIAVGATGLTLAKLREAKKLLRAAEVDLDEDELYMAVSAEQLDDLLSDSTITSADFNTVKALVNGDIDSFMGFKFVHTERLTTDGSGDRQVIAWAKSGIGLAIGMDITGEIAKRADKRFSWYAYYCATVGAVRIEDVKVVEIACAE